ncbi:MAG: hypothetical protein ACKOEV_03990, partial [Cytophagales bacterium]
ILLVFECRVPHLESGSATAVRLFIFDLHLCRTIQIRDSRKIPQSKARNLIIFTEAKTVKKK